MKFQPASKKVKNLFSNNNIYQIPNFQRDYSWSKNNFNHFLDDLLTVSNARFDKLNKKLIIQSSDDLEDYFFGTFLVVGSDVDDTTKKIVVDGQQRLTTMTIFLAAIRDNIEKIKKKSNIEYHHGFDSTLMASRTVNGNIKKEARVVNEKLNPILPINILDINKSNKNKHLHEPQNESQKLLINTFNWFKKELSIENLVKRLNNNISCKNLVSEMEYLVFLDTLGNQLLHSTVITIFSDDNDSANVIYRNFNFRGIPLSAPDLIKNELFQMLEDSSDSLKTNWTNIENNISNNEHSDLTTFMSHYFSSKWQSTNKNSLFNVFNKKIDNTIEDYSKFIFELEVESRHYKSIINPSDEDKLFGENKYFKFNDHPTIKRYLISLNNMNIIQTRVVLLSIFYAHDNNIITSKQFKSLIQYIIDFQTLYLVGKGTPNTLRRVYFNYAKKFRETKKGAESIKLINSFKKELLKLIPNVEQFESLKIIEFKSVSNSQNIIKNKTIIKQILTKIEKDNQTSQNKLKKNDSFKFIDDCSLEHVINQSCKQIKNRYRLGNIILLEEDIHSNDDDKLEMYKNSKIIMANEFFENHASFNTDKEIIDREKNLLKRYHSIVTNELKK